MITPHRTDNMVRVDEKFLTAAAAIVTIAPPLLWPVKVTQDVPPFGTFCLRSASILSVSSL